MMKTEWNLKTLIIQRNNKYKVKIEFLQTVFVLSITTQGQQMSLNAATYC